MSLMHLDYVLLLPLVLLPLVLLPLEGCFETDQLTRFQTRLVDYGFLIQG
jgi:hypothetical protein